MACFDIIQKQLQNKACHYTSRQNYYKTV